jgi:tetratricopeptide (TPR) repeat protein
MDAALAKANRQSRAMAGTLTPSEEGQLAQTIEMFEVITQSQPQDFQSLEILKEAYSKLGREKDVVGTSKRIAQAYVHMGQLSSAILEYETILQRCPEDADVQNALRQIETRANNFPVEPVPAEAGNGHKGTAFGAKAAPGAAGRPVGAAVDDGRRAMHKIFVEGKLIAAADFDLCWTTPDLKSPQRDVVEPFIQVLADRGLLPLEKSLKLLSEKSKMAYLPLGQYEIDLELARSFPAESCRRWCIIPFDRMSKSVLVATANPFNQQAARELAAATTNRLLWYVAPPPDLVKYLRRAFR